MTAIKTGSSTEEHRAEQNVRLRLLNIVAVILTLVLLYLLVVVIGPTVYNKNAGGIDSLPVSIRAGSAADYSHDAHAVVIPPISENIINQVIMDMPATGSPQERAAMLQDILSSPVPTMTPDLHLQATSTPTPDLHLQATSTPTLPLPGSMPTAVMPSEALSPTPFPTATQVYPSTSTAVGASPTPTLPAATVGITLVPTTPVPVVITPTNQPIPTNTPVPPKATATPQPASTSVPTKVPKPTNTHRPTKKP